MTRRAGQAAVLGLVVAGVIVATASGSGVALSWFIPFAGVGAILVIRRPRTSIGWILLGLGWAHLLVTVSIPGTVEQFANATFDMPGDLFVVVHNASIAVLFYLYLVLATVFPSGRLPSGGWGRLGRIALAAGLFMVVAGCVMPIINAEIVGYPTVVHVRNPIAFMPDLAIWRMITPETAGFPIMALVLPAAVSLGVRVRRSSGTEHQQLRWIAASIGIVVLAVICGFVLWYLVPGSAESGLAWIPAYVAFPTVPIAIGVAVLRYRLYEIDRIISRTVGYLLVTTLLVIVFTAVVVGLQAILTPFTQGETVAVAGSTLLAARCSSLSGGECRSRSTIGSIALAMTPSEPRPTSPSASVMRSISPRSAATSLTS
jgi:hypothetical protein